MKVQKAAQRPSGAGVQREFDRQGLRNLNTELFHGMMQGCESCIETPSRRLPSGTLALPLRNSR